MRRDYRRCKLAPFLEEQKDDEEPEKKDDDNEEAVPVIRSAFEEVESED